MADVVLIDGSSSITPEVGPCLTAAKEPDWVYAPTTCGYLQMDHGDWSLEATTVTVLDRPGPKFEIAVRDLEGGGIDPTLEPLPSPGIS